MQDDTYWQNDTLIEPVVLGDNLTLRTSWNEPISGLDPTVTGEYLYVKLQDRSDGFVGPTLGG